MTRPATLAVPPGRSLRRSELPRVPFPVFRDVVVRSVAAGAQLLGLFGLPGRPVELLALLGDPEEHVLHWVCTTPGESWPSLTPSLPAAHLFERLVAEDWGVVPEGHPNLKPVRFHASRRPGHDAWGRPEGAPIPVGVMDYYRVEGDEVHEVAVGPVHAGVIEPGHFRFQCHGEEVLHLEISLGYQHRGVERLLEGGPDARTSVLLETAAGDTSVGHGTAGCQVLEALAGCAVPPRASRIRALALELERLANHCGDLGALAGDVGYLPTASHCGRLRGNFLNMTAVLAGNRMGRGLVRPGGVVRDLPGRKVDELRTRLEEAMEGVTLAVDLLFGSASARARLEETGRVLPEDARALGLRGPAARACGLEEDARRDFPWGPYAQEEFRPVTFPSGDVEARARVRWGEMQQSAELVRRWLGRLEEGPVREQPGPLAPDSAAAAVVEGWRGAVLHLALTDRAGRLESYRIADPSIQNWSGLAMALRGTAISDFPLCNKSFNLSYCGFDL